MVAWVFTLLLQAAPVPVVGATDVAVGSVSGYPGCVLDATGVQCWGAAGDLVYGARPVQGLEGAAAFPQASATELCVVWRDGGVRCKTRGGALRDLGITSVVQLAQAADFACARIEDGTVSCWGSSLNCAVGVRPENPDCNSSVQLSPARVQGVTGSKFISLSQYGGCSLDGEGALTCWGVTPLMSLPPDAGHWIQARYANRVRGLPPLERFALGIDGTCAVARGGQVLCGQVGGGTPPIVPKPIPGPPLKGVSHLAFGYQAVVFVLADGTAWIYGPGLEPDPRVPGTPKRPDWSAAPRRIPGINDAVKVSVTYDHACLLTRSGKARCFGTNSSGELGDGTQLGKSEGQLADAARFELEELPEPKGGVGGCTADLELRRSCFQAGDQCALRPAPRYWEGDQWCSGVPPPQDWYRRQREAQKAKPVPSCLCTCSPEYQQASAAMMRERARCSMVP